MTDPHAVPRDSRRVPIETRVQLKFERFAGFISEFSSNVSPGGMFVRTRSPKPAGTILSFEFRLRDGFELIRGRGEVIWIRTVDESAEKRAGMGIRFLELSPGSRELIYKIVDEYILAGGVPFDLAKAPAPVPPVVDLKPPAAPAPPRPEPPPAEPPPTEPPPAPAPSPAAEPALPAFRADPASQAPEEVAPPLPPSSSSPRPAARPVPPLEPFQWPAVIAPPVPPAPAAAIPPPAAKGATAAQAPRPAGSPVVRWRVLRWGLLVTILGLGALTFFHQEALLGWILRREDAAAPRPLPVTRSAPLLARPPVATVAGAAVPAMLPAGAEPPVSAVTELRKITWEKAPGGGTDVLLWGDAAFDRQGYTHLRVEGDPPRELVRLSGILHPFAVERMTIDTPQVLQLRTGYHAGPRGELHVVLDLTGPGVEITDIRVDAGRLRIHLQGE